MRPFEHIDAASVEEVLSLLQSEPDSAILAGGTDLLVLMKNRIVNPTLLINVKKIGGLDRIEVDGTNGLAIGSLATMTRVGEEPFVRRQLPILAEAIGAAASPQLRNVATIAGNLCQRPRCHYYRESFDCFLSGKGGCHAPSGRDRDAGVFGDGECHAVNPSDLAPPLVALGASAVVQDSKGRRRVSLEDFFIAPKDGLLKLNNLGHDEMIVEIRIPRQPEHSRGMYLKAMERKTWSFAQASAAIQVSLADARVADVRIVLGGVAAVPWRARAAEDVLRGNTPTAKLVESASDAAVRGARPLGSNGYKVKLARALVKRGLSTLLGLQ
mgnify:CR=1 FL=1